jgi:hypothetical protein
LWLHRRLGICELEAAVFMISRVSVMGEIKKVAGVVSVKSAHLGSQGNAARLANN